MDDILAHLSDQLLILSERKFTQQQQLEKKANDIT
ncbi:MAG: hypothetical protein K0R16_128 [Nitrososphaeraceae archaeon]|nr:hypothetical protein [Nitrososphaeraceae archaeon]